MRSSTLTLGPGVSRGSELADGPGTAVPGRTSEGENQNDSTIAIVGPERQMRARTPAQRSRFLRTRTRYEKSKSVGSPSTAANCGDGDRRPTIAKTSPAVGR